MLCFYLLIAASLFPSKLSRYQNESVFTSVLFYFKSFRSGCDSLDSSRQDVIQELQKSNPELKKMEHEFAAIYNNLGSVVKRDIFNWSQIICVNMSKDIDTKPIDDLAELAQTYYNKFSQKMEAKQEFQDINPEIKEKLLDFVEKYTMTCLYR